MFKIPKSENEQAEFKTSFSEETIETLVAFANAKGGSVYIGITDNNKVSGLTFDEQSQKFFDNNTEKSREKSREKILKLIETNVFITQNEIAETIGISVKGVEKNIIQLKKEGLLERIGPDKGGHWEVNLSSDQKTD